MTSSYFDPQTQTQQNTNSGLSREETASLIDEALARQRDQHEAEIKALREEVASAHSTVHALVTARVPEHSGGAGNSSADTWSLADQELAARGEHPSQNK